MKGSWPLISQWFWGYDFCTIHDTNEDPISGPGFRQCCAVLDCCSEVSKVFTVILFCAWFVHSILWPCFRRKAPSFDFFNLLHYRRMLRTGNMTSSTWSSRPLCWLSRWWVDTARSRLQTPKLAPFLGFFCIAKDGGTMKCLCWSLNWRTEGLDLPGMPLRMWFIVGLMLFCTILSPLKLGSTVQRFVAEECIRCI